MRCKAVQPLYLCMAAVLVLLFLCSAGNSYAHDGTSRKSKKVVSAFAKDVGLQDRETVILKTVPKGKTFILTDVVADGTFGNFRFTISDKISLSVNIVSINTKEFAVSESPSWHFNSGIPFPAGWKIIVNRLEGRGNVFISGYLIDE